MHHVLTSRIPHSGAEICRKRHAKLHHISCLPRSQTLSLVCRVVMSDPVSASASQSHLQSAARGDLAAPRSRTTTCGQRSFSVSGPSLWNSTSLGNSGLCWTVFARNRDTVGPAEGNGDLQTLICVLVARPRRCLTLSNPVPWQNWMAAYLGYTLWRRTLFRGWPIMVNDTHTRRRRLWNSLLLSVRDPSLTMTQFCTHLKTFLFCWAYCT